MKDVDISYIENQILFWTLVVAIISIIVTILIGLVEHFQCAKLNSVNILKETLETAFNKYLIENFSERIENCNYRKCQSKLGNERFVFSLNNLTTLHNCITNFMGEIAFLKFAFPQKYNRINKKAEKIIHYIDPKMINHAEDNNYVTDSHNKALSKKESKHLYNGLRKRVKKFYKYVFHIYKYGL